MKKETSIMQPICILISCLLSICSLAQTKKSEEIIHLNQTGFFPTSLKTAIIITDKSNQFSLISASNLKDTIYTSTLTKGGLWQASDEETYKANFSEFTKTGDYILYVKKIGNSHPFSIQPQVYNSIAKASIKAFYYQRASMELTPEYADKFARKAGHPDNKVLVHNSAASQKRPTGTVINSPKGWYDAGDYNKYIVNSGISTYTLLSLYEDFTSYSKTVALNIPESNNTIPDLLDEINWNLSWMFTMQDPEDGGVYHKLTTANFEGFIKPNEAVNTRYVVQKTTAAALDFAAVMAQASRVYKSYEKEMPGYADSCLIASKKAFEWAKKNPNVVYHQNELNNPAISTGAYGDNNVSDEFFWAASELFVTTSDMVYYNEMKLESKLNEDITIPDWSHVSTLAFYTLLRNEDQFSKNKKVSTLVNHLKLKFLAKAKMLHNAMNQSPYGIPMGNDIKDFAWGSNAVAANQSIFLLKAYLLNKEPDLLNAAQANADYILGQNATGYSFITGFGVKSPKNPHHRPSFSDGIEEPIPGLLVGGPNPGQQDLSECNGITYPLSKPALSYMDVQCSYASNEIAINWNAPIAYVLNAIEAIKNNKTVK